MSTKTGMDKSMMTEDMDNEGDDDFITHAEVWSDIRQGMRKRHYRIEADSNGIHSGHSIYKKVTVDVNPGMTTWRRLNTGDEYDNFVNNLAMTVRELSGNGSAWLKVATTLTNCFGIQAVNKTNIVASLGYGRSKYPGDAATAKRSYTGSSDAFKQLPLVSWFPQLADLSPKAILTLFPDAEAETLMLILGRALVGRSGAKCVEGAVEHKARAAAIIVGTDAGLGKSTLLNGIIDAMESLGFHTATIGNPGAKFGMGNIATSDLAYKDDLTNESQKAFLQSDNIKSIITGARINTENKGQDSLDTECSTVLLACSNHYNRFDFYGMDSGSLARFNFLHTYTRQELLKAHPDFDGKTLPRLNALCTQYDVTPRHIFTHLLAHSAKLFLDTIGYTLVEGQIVRVKEDVLEDAMNSLRERMVLSPEITHVRELLEACADFTAFSICTSGKKNIAKALENVDSNGFTTAILLGTMLGACDPVGNNGFTIKGLNNQCLKNILNKADLLSNEKGDKTYAEHFAKLAAELAPINNATYPKTADAYAVEWNKVKGCIPELTMKYKALIDEKDDDDLPLLNMEALNKTTKAGRSFIFKALTELP